MEIGKFIGRRVIYLFVVVNLVVFVVTNMFELLPGNPAYALLGNDPNVSAEQIRRIEESLNLDQGPIQRYLEWIGNALTGDLGTSFLNGVPTTDTILDRLPVTIEVLLLAQIIALTYALGTGLYSAYKPGGVVDRVSSTISLGLLSVPTFVLGIVIVLYVSKLGWFPVAGFVPFTDDPWENLRTVAMPALVLAADPAAIYQRLLRGDAARTLREDYITVAHSKGISDRTVLLRHALRPSLFSTVTLAGLTTVRLIGSALVVESIFAVPGMGSWLIQSVQNSDYSSIQAGVVVIAVMYVIMNTLVDLSYRILDPRTGATG